MREIPSNFLESLSGSHRSKTQALVVAPGQTGVEPTGTEIPIIEGYAQFDSTADIRSIVSMSTDGYGMFPDNADDLLTIYGNEVFIRRGIYFGNGAIVWVSQGYFRINSVEQSDAPNGPIDIQATDRMGGIIEARLLAPTQFPATATYGDVIDDLVAEVYPWAVIQWDDFMYTDAIGRSVIAEDDRFKFLNELVTSIGKIWYWDERGVLVIKDPPAEDLPVWEISAGENGVLVNMSRDLSREGVYNAVVATGEALDTATPATATATDNNPDSPTYYNGSFGKVPRFYSSPFITTTAQAQSAANSLLRQKLGVPYAVDLGSIVNPALEPLDSIAVNITGTSTEVSPRSLIADTFSRTVVDSWGTSDSGQVWTPASATTHDVTSGYGTIQLAVNTIQTMRVTGVTEPDVEGFFKVQVPALSTGAAMVVGGATRFIDTTHFYQLRLEFNVGTAVAMKISKYDGGLGLVELAGINPIPGLTYTAGQTWNVRFRDAGSVLKVRAWVDGTAEPQSWTLETYDNSFVAGSVGVFSYRVAGNTNVGVQLKINEFSASTYVNSNSEIHVVEKVTIPFSNDQAMKLSTREQTLVVIGEV